LRFVRQTLDSASADAYVHAGVLELVVEIALGVVRRVLDLITSGFFCPDHPETFRPIVDKLLSSDPFLLLADYRSYVECQEQVAKAYEDQDKWAKMAILNVARMGKFSSDRTIDEYAKEIWHAKACPISLK